ncbi:unnamed protein product [Effrenium voratum]|uniref:Uncharacterized protein n=1 Tax=Effrenium voratum TaxID=2562239 RepID=A0AA36IY77_9DINO|nr:unnamed protein product [Effrenium voratum]CAJ1445712.1 unnamed protein product [Effrenium voratum]
MLSVRCAAPRALGARGFAKYTRKGIWARGDYGLYTMDDPRIFRPPPPRQYPYHKQRKWSKPYYCVRNSAAGPMGTALKLVVLYRKFDMAPAFYEVQRLLHDHLPGAQILAEAVDPQTGDQCLLRILRLNDGSPGRELWMPGEDDKARLRMAEEKVVKMKQALVACEQQVLRSDTVKVSEKRALEEEVKEAERSVAKSLEVLVQDVAEIFQKDLEAVVKAATDNFACRYGEPLFALSGIESSAQE